MCEHEQITEYCWLEWCAVIACGYYIMIRTGLQDYIIITSVVISFYI